MDHLFLLHTHSIMAFILATTQLGMLIYLIKLRTNTTIRRWMIINYSASVIWQADQTIRMSLHPSIPGTLLYKLETVLIYSPALAVLVLSYLQILYLFLHQPYERERRMMVRIVVPVIIGLVGINVWNEFANNSNLFVLQAVSFIYGFITNIWALVISIRKARLLKNIDRQAAKAHNILVLVNLGFIFMCLIAVIFGLYSPIGYWTFFIFIWLCNLAQIVVYITFSAVPASFQIKIAGFSFVTVVTFLTVVTLVFFPPLLPTDIALRMGQQRGLRQMFIIIAGATLFVVSVLPGLLRNSLSEPLKRLLAGVKQVNTGDLTVKVAVGSPDEIGDLTVNFNQMTHSLKQKNDEVLEYTEKLEEKVAERTAALKNSLDKLRATQAQLLYTEKMASLGELTSGIAHEIQNPLNFVNNFSEIGAEMLTDLKKYLAEGKPADAIAIADELKESLLKITHHGGRASDIVKGMLEHSKGSNGQRSQISIGKLCRQYAQLSYNSMVAKIGSFSCNLQFDFNDAADSIYAIEQDIARVFQNVFANALYAVHQKCTQQANALPPYEPKIIVYTHICLMPDGLATGTEICIKDNGTGMTENVRSKIFQPFFTTKPAGKGTGLGLSISYDIITKGHGGSFTAQSTMGEGTEMIIRLPANSGA